MKIEVESLSNKPTDYWRIWKNSATVMRLKVKNPSHPVPENMVRFVCMSDTHSLTSHITQSIPDGDVFIHAGDFTRSGSISEVREFNTWLAKLPHKNKIVIAGNHELIFDPSLQGFESRSGHIGTSNLPLSQKMLLTPHSGISGTVDSPSDGFAVEHLAAELSNCTYLQDTAATVCGLKVFGSPWQPEFGDMAFNLPRGEKCLERWNLIPEDTDILVTHGPPLGFGDLCCTGVRAGCVELLSTVQKRVKPKYHIYGHIHEGYGIRSDGKIVFINASTCDINYRPCNPPVVFDVPVPNGFAK